MEIKASVNIFEGGVEESVNFSIRDRYNRGRNFDFSLYFCPHPTWHILLFLIKLHFFNFNT